MPRTQGRTYIDVLRRIVAVVVEVSREDKIGSGMAVKRYRVTHIALVCRRRAPTYTYFSCAYRLHWDKQNCFAGSPAYRQNFARFFLFLVLFSFYSRCVIFNDFEIRLSRLPYVPVLTRASKSKVKILFSFERITRRIARATLVNLALYLFG